MKRRRINAPVPKFILVANAAAATAAAEAAADAAVAAAHLDLSVFAVPQQVRAYTSIGEAAPKRKTRAQRQEERDEQELVFAGDFTPSH